MIHANCWYVHRHMTNSITTDAVSIGHRVRIRVLPTLDQISWLGQAGHAAGPDQSQGFKPRLDSDATSIYRDMALAILQLHDSRVRYVTVPPDEMPPVLLPRTLSLPSLKGNITALDAT